MERRLKRSTSLPGLSNLKYEKYGIETEQEIQGTFYLWLGAGCERRAQNIYYDLMNKYDVQEFITVCGRYSKAVKRFTEWLCSRAEEVLTDAEEVWVGYEPGYPFTPVFVAEVKNKNVTVDRLFNKFQIIQRLREDVSDEAQYVANLEMTEQLEFTDAEQVAIQKCLSMHTAALMKKHSNLLIVSASKVKARKQGTNDAMYTKTTCIVFYVRIKSIIPFNEDTFPTELDGFPTDVREGTFKTYGKSSDFHERLLMGCQIVTAYNVAVSLGGFVETDNGKIGCLTCGHAFETVESVADLNKDPVNQQFFRKEVYQPQVSSGFEFGKVKKLIISPGDSNTVGVDAALIEITNQERYPCTGAFPDAVSLIAGK